MDTSSAIIGAIFLAACIAPFIILTWRRKIREKRMLQNLNEIASQHNCQISQHELCADFAIGIDETRDFLFFYRKHKDHVDAQAINLKEIQKCKVGNTSRKVKNKNDEFDLIENLELNLLPAEANKAPIVLEVFNTSRSTQMAGQLQVVEKWSEIISTRLKKQVGARKN